MSKPTRRQGSAVYYARRVVPKDLRAVYGKTNLWLSLHERELEAAKPKDRLQQVKWDEEFAAARSSLAARAAPRLPEPYPFQSPEHEDGEEEQHRLLDKEHAELEADPILRARVQHAQMLQSEVWDRQFAAELKDEARAARAAAEPVAKGTHLSEVVRLWAKEQTPMPKSVDRMSAVISWFEDFLGRIPVEAITPEDIMTFKDRLLAKTSGSNARTKMQNFTTLMRFAVKARIIKGNPAADISVTVKQDPEEDVQPFDLVALEAIFGSPVYREGARPPGGAGEAAYWLPLLALYTGARLNELGQLRPKDVVQLPYVDHADQDQLAWVIKILADKAEGLRLKNASSARRVPIHAELIRLGFLTYVEAAREAGQTRIFPALRPDKYGTVTANWSKWFGRYLRDPCGVASDRMRFHSFRHAFKDYVREMEIGEDANDAFTGHNSPSTARKYGSTLNFPLRPLVTGMQKYRVTGLKLPAPPPGLQEAA